MSDERASNIWFLRKTSLFKDQSESMYESVDSHSQAVDFERGDVLQLRRGGRDVIFVLMSGQVKLRSFTEGGKEIILDVLGPDDAFGPLESTVGRELPAVPPAGSGTEAVALSKGSALQFDFDSFSDLVYRRPTLVVNLTKMLGMRQKRLELRLARLLYRSSLGKVAGLLAELGERYGALAGETIEVNLRLTHQEMASIVGVKRETVSECLAELELQGLISAQRGKVVLLKPESLDRIG